MDFSKRLREDELMDDLGLSPSVLQETYNDIDRANKLLGGDAGTLNALKPLILNDPKKRYSVIDIGCGNGAILRKVCDFLKSRNLEVKLMGIDVHESAIKLARAASTDYPEIEYRIADVLQVEPKDFNADIVLCTLTLHHISEEHISAFLTQITRMACIGVIINDLQRSRFAYCLFKMFSVIFIKTKIAKNDGLVSIRSGFTKKELLRYTTEFPELEHDICSKWAFRYVWVMRVKRPRLHE